MTEQNKPLALNYAEAKNNIVNSINQANHIHGVPFFLIEGVLTELMYQVKANAKIEYERAEKEYKTVLEEQEKGEEIRGD